MGVSRSKAGFDKNPQNINKKGRPKKEFTMTKILSDVLNEEIIHNGDKILAKEAVARKMIAQALAGDSVLLKYCYDRIDGTPRQSIDHTSEGNKIVFDVIYGEDKKDGSD